MIIGEPWPKTPKATQVHPLCLQKRKNAKMQKVQTMEKCKNAKMQNAFQDAPGQDMISACGTCVLLLSPVFPRGTDKHASKLKSKNATCKIAPRKILTKMLQARK